MEWGSSGMPALPDYGPVPTSKQSSTGTRGQLLQMMYNPHSSAFENRSHNEEDELQDDSIFHKVMGPIAYQQKGVGLKKERLTTQAAHRNVKINQQHSPREKMVAEENLLLIQLLQQAKVDREQLLTDLAVFKKRVLEKEINVMELETRRALEIQTFRAALQKERIKFDEKLLAVQKTLRNRDKLIIELVEICTSYSIISPNAAVKSTIEKASWYVPKAKEAAVAIYRKYVSDASNYSGPGLGVIDELSDYQGSDDEEINEVDDEVMNGDRQNKSYKYTQRSAPSEISEVMESTDSVELAVSESKAKSSGPSTTEGDINNAQLQQLFPVPPPNPPIVSSNSIRSSSIKVGSPVVVDAVSPGKVGTTEYRDDFEEESDSDKEPKPNAESKSASIEEIVAPTQNNKKKKKKKSSSSDSDSSRSSSSDSDE